MVPLRHISLCILFGHSLVAQTITTSPPPANVVLVPSPYAYYLAKHPSLPVVYLSCTYAPESRNLVTYPLNSDGTVNTNAMRGFNYFSDNPTNEFWRYSVQRPIVLPDERILYLGVIPSQPNFLAHSNHQEIAAVALDDAGQPGRVLQAMRTTHSEKEIRGWQFEPTTRRLYLSYHTYLGWIPVGKDGLLESDKFHLINYVQTCWDWRFVPEWKRFYARQTDGALVIFKLGGDGVTPDFDQTAAGWFRGAWNFELNREFRKVYFLDRGEKTRLVVFRLTREGRLAGLPAFFPLDDAAGIRFDFKRKSLYAWSPNSLLCVYALDDRGLPTGGPELSNLNCGVIRDMLVEEATGKVYVACTEMPKSTP